jgi:hypothetical protein
MDELLRVALGIGASLTWVASCTVDRPDIIEGCPLTMSAPRSTLQKPRRSWCASACGCDNIIVVPPSERLWMPTRSVVTSKSVQGRDTQWTRAAPW